uniref:HMG box domain-containing protein n=1 Tax=Attheya septentrionalis TaxID=420275 RepID=A0A7S2XMI0_9STRA|mmetsp:Transcript_20905/g.37748  ORF Transcript_20905/g.37748 Transcript_20905/m.37748 type:complete len:636 (+) Transcript_20905:1882-3789(+)
MYRRLILPAKLDNWVGVQKRSVPIKAEKGHPVYVERKKLLDDIKFEYDNVSEAKWEKMFERLKQYHSTKGNCRVPDDYDDGSGGPSLCVWARRQQHVPNKAVGGDLKYVERKRLLDTLHFEYDKVDEAKWKSMFNVLKRYHSEHGHCEVPLAYGDSNNDAPRALGRWCREQRKNVPVGLAKDNANSDYKERKRLLDSMGFKWVVEYEKEKKWNASFERLKSFKQENGHCIVPPDLSGQGVSLYSWVRNQQKVLAKVDIGDPVYIERKKRLDSIGFEWTRMYDDQWDKMYMSLVEYKSQNGHCQVSYRGKGAVDGPSGQLGIWVYHQRTKVPQKASEGDPVYIQRKQRLDYIGFEWLDVHSSRWEGMFAGLQRFHEKHGHARVKRDYKDVDQPLPTNLGSWQSTQRKQILEDIEKGDEVAVERKQRLDSLGFVWQTRAPPKAYERNGKVIQGRQKSSATLSGEPQRSRPKEQIQAERLVVNATDSLPRQKAKLSGRSSVKATSSRRKEAAPGPHGMLVPFPDYDEREEPIMLKNAFQQFSRRLKKTVKESLDPSDQTKKNIKRALKDGWTHLAADEKEVYQKWAAWDKMRYERDVTIFEQQNKQASTCVPRKRKASRATHNSKEPIKTKKKRHNHI